jgi:hypothetical protein
MPSMEDPAERTAPPTKPNIDYSAESFLAAR